MNLLRRGVISETAEAKCGLCGFAVELTFHLFGMCSLSARLWYAVVNWLGFDFVMPGDLMILFSICCSYGTSSSCVGGLSLIWHTTIWVIWDLRNLSILSDQVPNWELAFDRIQSVSWRWFLARSRSFPCLFYEWVVNHLDCLARI